MKIGLVTFHTPINYGAILQGYALMSYLSNYGDVEVVDYNTKHLRQLYGVIKKPIGIRAWLKFPKSVLDIPSKTKKHFSFHSFIKKNYRLSARCNDYTDIQRKIEDYDVWFTGSDQVFNPTRIDEERNVFYLCFIKNSVPKFSYAASFGMKNIPEKDRMFVSSALSSFSQISVREKSGINIVKELSGKESEVTLDPVFLQDEIFWLKQANYDIKQNRPFILYYKLLGDSTGDFLVERISKNNNLKVVVISEQNVINKNWKILKSASPNIFLSCFSKADFVVTDSFHGVAFSIIFKKQFAFTDFDPIRSERGRNLMTELGIDIRSNLYGNDITIDYSLVDNRLTEMIQNSKQYIKECIDFVVKNND